MIDEPLPILIVPGLGNSGPSHWQTLWEARYPEARRVEMGSWDLPDRDEWLEALNEAIGGCSTAPVVVAHSLGVIAMAHWAARAPCPVHAALFVAPPDLERDDLPEAVKAFGAPPLERVEFRAVVAASTNDPFCTIDRAQTLSRAWEADLVILGNAGHVNTASGHGPWPEGEDLLEGLLSTSRLPDKHRWR